MIRLNVVVRPPLEVPAELLVVPLCEDIKPVKGFVGQLDWWLNGQISRLYKSRKFAGTPGQRALVPCVHWLPFGKLLLMGLGQSAGLNPLAVLNVHRALAHLLRSLRVESVTIMAWCPDVHGLEGDHYALALAQGLLEGIAECADKLALSLVNIPVAEEHRVHIVETLNPLAEHCQATSGLKVRVS